MLLADRGRSRVLAESLEGASPLAPQKR
jgi:hypothetical protein